MELSPNTYISEETINQNEISGDRREKAAKQVNLLFLSITGGVFTFLFILFLFLERPSYSELERRDLMTFPDYREYELSDYPGAVSEWFSDSEPYRDHFLTLSMNLRNAMKFRFRSDEEAVSFIATDEEMSSQDDYDESTQVDDDKAETAVHDPGSLIAENAKIANRGIVVAGNAPNARAMMIYGGSPKGGAGFVKMVNNYAATFPNVQMYVVIANTSGEFYMPSKVAVERNKSQAATLENIKSTLSPGVKYVDVWSELNNHKAEDIFSRTDHHWLPLGAYYAAKAFARTANVAFNNLDSYEPHVIHNFVGSMYGYSKDINVKNSPEDFIYYTPKNVEYTSTFIYYKANENFEVTSVSKPRESEFFKSFGDGNGNAYCTFMGGDQCTVHIKTNSNSSRKLLIIKDSYGNAVPGYLMYGFSDIHIVDFRYFNRNMKNYIEENGITDTAFVVGIFKVCSSGFCKSVSDFLTQKDGYVKTEPKIKEDERPSSIEESPIRSLDNEEELE